MIIGKMLLKVTSSLNLALLQQVILIYLESTWLAVGFATGPEPFLASFFLCTPTPPLTTMTFVNLKENALLLLAIVTSQQQKEVKL